LIIDSVSQLALEAGNTFTSNAAELSGGAVFWNYNEPKNISVPTYTSNTAGNYGNDYASFAQNLKTMTQTEYNARTTVRR
jgi:hypothetical protein